MRGRSGWKSSYSYQSSRGYTCQKQHVDILLLILISITTRHRIILAIFYCSFPLPAVKATIEASGAVLQRLLTVVGRHRRITNGHHRVGRIDIKAARRSQGQVGPLGFRGNPSANQSCDWPSAIARTSRNWTRQIVDPSHDAKPYKLWSHDSASCRSVTT